jgi:hypothetical protein
MTVKHLNKSGLLSIRLRLNSISKLLLLLALSVAASGQAISPTLQEPMRQLDFLVGEWKGKGWFYHFKGSKSEISQSIKIKIEPDGLALRIKDTKRLKDGSLLFVPNRIPESTIYYDDQAKIYRWRVEAAKGRGNPFEAKLIGPRTFQLIIHTPDSMGRITIKVTEEGEWHETFELLMSNGWLKVDETFLKKVK